MKISNEQDAIKQAAGAGYERAMGTHADILQNPAFWQALGKARGWGNENLTCRICGNDDAANAGDDFYSPTESSCECGTPAGGEYPKYEIEFWKYQALRYFETLLSGGSIEEYWKNLP